MLVGCGSEAITSVLRQARPAFAFFGHYHGPGRLEHCDFGPTQAFHLGGLELRGPGGCAEPRSVGVLRWSAGAGRFEYLSHDWLRTFARHNWRYR
jgi:hypothetical protein